MVEQPPPDPWPEYTKGQIERAKTNRQNALQELAGVMGKLMGPQVAVTNADLMAYDPQGAKPAKIMLHFAPSQLSELVVATFQTVKQLEIAFNCILDQLIDSRHLDPVKFMDACAKQATETAKIMHRGLLSQGQVKPDGMRSIITRN